MFAAINKDARDLNYRQRTVALLIDLVFHLRLAMLRADTFSANELDNDAKADCSLLENLDFALNQLTRLKP